MGFKSISYKYSVDEAVSYREEDQPNEKEWNFMTRCSMN